MDPVPKGKPYVSNSPLGANTERVASSSISLSSSVSASIPNDVQAAVSICQKTREEQLKKLEKINSDNSFATHIRSLEAELIELRVSYIEFHAMCDFYLGGIRHSNCNGSFPRLRLIFTQTVCASNFLQKRDA